MSWMEVVQPPIWPYIYSCFLLHCCTAPTMESLHNYTEIRKNGDKGVGQALSIRKMIYQIRSLLDQSDYPASLGSSLNLQVLYTKHIKHILGWETVLPTRSLEYNLMLVEIYFIWFISTYGYISISFEPILPYVTNLNLPSWNVILQYSF